MTVRFYFDENVPDQIADGARLRDGHRRTDDSVLLDRAGLLGQVMFSRAVDLIAEAVRRQ